MAMDVGKVAGAVALDDPSTPLHEIESLCMRCGENGITRLLMTRIPHFREIVIMAFECLHCNERNNEVQFAGQLQPYGCHFELKVPKGSMETLNRQVVKSDSASIKVPELEFEVPAEAQRGTLSTVEGVLMRAAEELQALQEERKKANPTLAEALDKFLIRLTACAKGDQDFTFILDDPSGNSFIENPNAPSEDPSLSVQHYKRTHEQQEALGFLSAEDAAGGIDSTEVAIGTEPSEHSQLQFEGRAKYIPAGTKQLPHGTIGAGAAYRAIANSNSEDVTAALFKYSAPEEVMIFPSTCGACAARSETRMYVTNIPYFKEVIVMSSACDLCGYKNSELKPGGSIPAKGKRVSVQILNKSDLCRDVIKSDTATVIIPELDLELASGTLGGLVTTVEGLVMNISESLERVHQFDLGDSASPSRKRTWKEFVLRIKELVNVHEPWTLILDDALANSFIAPATDNFEDDIQLKIEEYERTWEQNEELGLNDMDTTSADAIDSSTSHKQTT